MELSVAANVAVTIPGCERLNCHELLAWLNETLLSDFTEVEQTCTGAAYCQLIERLFPNCLDLSSIRFQISSTDDVIHNYSLLQAAFTKVGVVRYIPVKELMKKNSVVSLTFLLWFQRFFMKNVSKERKNPALEASGGQRMDPQKVKDARKTEVEAGRKKSSGSSKDNSDVIVLISDGEDIIDVTEVKESKTREMETTVTESQRIKAVQEEAAVDTGNKGSGDALLHFLRKYCGDSMDTKLNTSADSPVDAILSPTHPDDIIKACSCLPYCLYLYVGLELGRGQDTSVVLVGYYNQTLGVSVVQPLLTLQMSVNEQTPADADTDTHAADADARLLIEMLRKSGLPLSGVAAFYCNAPHPGVSQVFVSHFQAFSPRLVSLCGLPGTAERACQAGISASFSCVVELVRDIHYHYHSNPSISNSLKGLFASAVSYNPSHPISVQCLFLIPVVQEMVSRWRSLVDYFKSVRQAKDAHHIRARLIDHKVRLRFVFLSQVLEPLRALQELQQSGTLGVAAELQLTSMLVRSYATGLLQPTAADCFLRKRDLQLLQNRMALLSVAEVPVGDRAREFMWATAVIDLGEEDRRDFKKDAAAFYKAALQSLVESLPEHLGEVALKNISTLLKHSENTSRNKLSRNVLSVLAVQLGLFNAEPAKEHQLACDYSGFINSVKGQSGWAKMLQCTRPHSDLHRLFLTLLALPSSLHRTQVFAKVFNKAPPPTKETPKALIQSCSWADPPHIRKLRNSVKAGCVGKEKTEENKDKTSSEGAEAKHSLSLPPKIIITKEDSDYTDNSSDVVEVTEESKTKQSCRLMPAETDGRTLKEQSAFIDEDDDVDDGWVIPTSTPDSAELLDVVGELVWAHMEGSSPWPAIIIPCKIENELPDMRMVKWYGQRISSQISLQALKPFVAFIQHFSSNSFAVLITYREAVFLSLQEAALRCDKQFSAGGDSQDELLKQMLDWAFGGFLPTGPDGLKPTAATLTGLTETTTDNKPKVKQKVFPKASSSPLKSGKRVCEEWEGEGNDCSTEVNGEWKGGKVQKKKSSLLDGFDDVPRKKRTYTKSHNKDKEETSTYTQPDQKVREETIHKIMDMQLDIDGFCLCCGTEDVEIFHPLFKGSLCSECADNLRETLYCYDEDGYQSYCTICCYGLEVILCGNDSCCRTYCEDCLNILVGPGTSKSVKLLDPWVCYLCQPHQTHGALVPREDWRVRVQELFANNNKSDTESVSSTQGVTKENGSSEGSEAETRRQEKGGWEGERDDWRGRWDKGRGRGKGGWKGGKVQKKKSSLFDESDDDMSPDFVPYKKRTYTKSHNKVNQATSTYTQPDQKVREETIHRIMDMQLDIDGFCLCCGTEDVEIFHPLFKGSLCSECADNLRETLYRYDEDGYQSYCTICCYGLEVMLCGNDSCCRTYCEDCLNILVGSGTFESLKLLDPWVCYLCQPHQTHGALVPREDWSVRVQELFANNSAIECEPHRVYPSIPANLRRPIRVLSLFDGIATGYLVLKDLGFKVEKYVASEICEDSLAVATINHNGKIIHVNDVRFITQKHIEQWGPFDLLIGGSPCNDLSIVNPHRKGLYEGTGRLFFDYYRILQLLKPEEDDPRPFFWLFENVVFMNLHDKANICRFLECNPVLVDAVKVSPAHRARCFWGNIPGMSRPITASQKDKLNLQDCLEIGREARVTKVRTITTNPYSLRQGKGFSQLPVLQDGKVDNLWITEVEKIFGFPKHYTDVRNMNRQQRQTVLGKAWSVPVIRHLFAPLKDYFACEELPPLTTSTTTSSPLTSSPSSPELQQLR